MNDYGKQEPAFNTDELTASAKDLASRAEELLQSTSAMTTEGIAALRTKLGESLKTAREQISAAQSYASDKAKAAASTADDYVHDKPWQAIAVAALVGVVIGFLSSGSRR